MLPIITGISIFSAILLSNPNERMGDAHYSQQNIQEAIHYYSEAITEEPENAVVYYKRARAYLMNNQYEEYHQDISRALELNPNLAGRLSDKELLDLRPLPEEDKTEFPD